MNHCIIKKLKKKKNTFFNFNDLVFTIQSYILIYSLYLNVYNLNFIEEEI